METSTITVELEKDIAQIYSAVTPENQKKVQLLFSLCLQEFGNSSLPLMEFMDQISSKAQTRGLTPEILDTLLHAE